MKAHIISIGNELLIGDTVNTNAAWIGRILTDEGIEVVRIHTVADHLDTIVKAIRESMKDADLVIGTGGLGPTHDDVTKKALQSLFDVKLIVHEETLNFIRKVFEERNLPFSPSNYRQAEVPENCEVLFNSQGTAPGMWFVEKDTMLAVLPGVPHEMKYLMREKVLPRLLESRREPEQRVSRYLVTAGIGESTLSDEVIGDLGPFLNGEISVAFLPDPQGSKIRISSSGKTQAEVMEKIEPVIRHIYSRAGNLIIGEGRELTLSEAAGKVLREQNLTIATAESCTGGLLADTLTDVPGSSDYLIGGIVAYSNAVKMNYLDVEKDVLQRFGAVSKQTALQMARGVARRFQSGIGVSTTGIAGPGGGTKEKPVGTVWIGYWSNKKHFALHALFTNDRMINKKRTVAVALETVRRCLLDIEPMPYGLEPYSA